MARSGGGCCPSMDLMRSEAMQLLQVIIPTESAHLAVSHLGDLGLIQFKDHHCQRCGGLFCSSCTQQRMVLRGQGDSPVRICDPCKKLEEAALYELRYGHKNRAGKGGV